MRISIPVAFDGNRFRELVQAELDISLGRDDFMNWGEEIEIAEIADQATLEDIASRSVITDEEAIERRRSFAINEINKQSNEQSDVWQSAYTSYGDHLAILQVIEISLRAIRRDVLDAIEAATTIEEIETILAELTWPPVPDQATIEDNVGQSSVAVAEGKQFLQDTPLARLILDMPYQEMLDGIKDAYTTPNINQQIVLAQLNALIGRYIRELFR